MRRLSELLSACHISAPIVDGEVSSIEYDSRKCERGSLFFAFRGIHSSGSAFAKEAVARGAIAVFAEEEIPRLSAPLFVVERARSVYARMCAAFFDFPADKLFVIGVTGTDGKTTTCEYLHRMLTEEGVRTGLIDTVSIDEGEGRRPSPWRQSTPEAWFLNSTLARCVERGLSHVIIECTSHALSFSHDRLATISYDVAIVTTITSEHLDFHKTIGEYVDAKCNLPRRLREGGLFISTVKNPHLEECLKAMRRGARAIILGRDVRAEGDGLSLLYEGARYPVSVPLPVLVDNAALAAIALSAMEGKPLSRLLPSLSRLESVKGRMETIENKQGLSLIVDFAHTADAYAHLFPFVAERKGNGRLIALFGCAGERDKGKRAPMGAIASAHADALFLTDEDPRGERSADIDRDILAEAVKKPTFLIDDRRKAIRAALAYARKGDTLLFLGKGHERTIEKNGRTIPWNEREEIIAALRERKPCV